MNWYILNAHGEPVQVETVLEWARWSDAESARPILARNVTPNGEVTTKFIGTPAGHRRGVPLLFETLILGGALDGELCRYTSLAEATAGHWAMVIRAGGAAVEGELVG